MTLPEAPPGIVGTVTEVRRPPGAGAASPESILVEESPGQGKSAGCAKGSGVKGCNKLLLGITEQTSILRGAGEDLAPATGEELETGQRVRAWHEDVVTKSYPGQTIARVVVIEGTG